MLFALLLLTTMSETPDYSPLSRIFAQKCAIVVAAEIPASAAFKLASLNMRHADDRYRNEIIDSYASLEEAAHDLDKQLKIFGGETVPAAPSIIENQEGYHSMLSDRLGRSARDYIEYDIEGTVGETKIRYRQYCLRNNPKSEQLYLSKKIYDTTK